MKTSRRSAVGVVFRRFAEHPVIPKMRPVILRKDMPSFPTIHIAASVFFHIFYNFIRQAVNKPPRILILLYFRGYDIHSHNQYKNVNVPHLPSFLSCSSKQRMAIATHNTPSTLTTTSHSKDGSAMAEMNKTIPPIRHNNISMNVFIPCISFLKVCPLYQVLHSSGNPSSLSCNSSSAPGNPFPP